MKSMDNKMVYVIVITCFLVFLTIVVISSNNIELWTKISDQPNALSDDIITIDDKRFSLPMDNIHTYPWIVSPLTGEWKLKTFIRGDPNTIGWFNGHSTRNRVAIADPHELRLHNYFKVDKEITIKNIQAVHTTKTNQMAFKMSRKNQGDLWLRVNDEDSSILENTIQGDITETIDGKRYLNEKYMVAWRTCVLNGEEYVIPVWKSPAHGHVPLYLSGKKNVVFLTKDPAASDLLYFQITPSALPI